MIPTVFQSLSEVLASSADSLARWITAHPTGAGWLLLLAVLRLVAVLADLALW